MIKSFNETELRITCWSVSTTAPGSKIYVWFFPYESSVKTCQDQTKKKTPKTKTKRELRQLMECSFDFRLSIKEHSILAPLFANHINSLSLCHWKKNQRKVTIQMVPNYLLCHAGSWTQWVKFCISKTSFFRKPRKSLCTSTMGKGRAQPPPTFCMCFP